MSRIKSALHMGALFACIATPAFAQTIDELTDAARAKRFSELRGGGSQSAGNSAAPAGMPPSAPAQPQAGPASAPPGDAPVKRKRTVQTEPYLLSIYGVGNRFVAEIAEDNAEAKYKVGDRTDSGWTVTAIRPREVTLKKYGKSGNVASTKTLTFWTPVDDREPVADDRPSGRAPASGPAALVNPPFPPGTFGR